MRVICINGDGLREMNNLENDDDYTLKTGEVYTVVDTQRHDGMDFYILSEKPFDCCYHVRRFAPLSDISETEFERNYQKEKIEA